VAGSSDSRKRSRAAGSRRPRWLTHRGLVAVEAVLLVGVLKDVAVAFTRQAAWPNYGKVLVAMALTVGVFGGLFVFVERQTARTVASTYKAVRSLSLVLPYWLIHVAVLAGLFLLYARHLGLQVP
jgi:hypothetical protein